MTLRKQTTSPIKIARESASEIILENPFHKNYKKISDIRHYNSGQLQIKQDDIRIALVSLEMPDNKIAFSESQIYDSRYKKCPIFTDKERCKRTTHYYINEQTHYENFQLALEIALEKYEADIVCFHELGFPTKNKKPFGIAVRYAKKMARIHNCIIIAGSWNDKRTLYNTGLVFYPEDVNDVNHEFYHKQTSANDVGEYISVPPNRSAVSIQAFGLRFGIIICLDLLDYSSIAPLCDRYNEIDFVFIPSFCDNITPMQRVAAYISEVLPGGVAIINRSLVGEQAHPGITYFFGKKLEYSDKNANYPHYIIRSIPNGKGKIILHDINYQEFTRIKQYTKQTIHEDLKWLFGIPTTRKARI